MQISGELSHGRRVLTHSPPFFCIHWRKRWQGEPLSAILRSVAKAIWLSLYPIGFIQRAQF